jgi:hypothetical protein
VFPLPGETSDARATAEEAIANMDALDSVQDQHIAQLIAAVRYSQQIRQYQLTFSSSVRHKLRTASLRGR